MSIRRPRSINDKTTHSVISQPHENVISVSKFISEIAQTSIQAKVIFNGVSFIAYLFLDFAPFVLPPADFTREGPPTLAVPCIAYFFS